MGVEGVGDDLALAVGDDVVGDMAEACEHEQRRIPHLTVADGAPLQGVARDLTATASDIGIEADAEDLELVLMAAVGALQAALLGGALVVPGGPDGDDIRLGVQIGGRDITAIDVDGSERGELDTFLECLETL